MRAFWLVFLDYSLPVAIAHGPELSWTYIRPMATKKGPLSMAFFFGRPRLSRLSDTRWAPPPRTSAFIASGTRTDILEGQLQLLMHPLINFRETENSVSNSHVLKLTDSESQFENYFTRGVSCFSAVSGPLDMNKPPSIIIGWRICLISAENKMQFYNENI